MNNNDITNSDWLSGYNRPLIIAGPCSAESEEQLLSVAQSLSQQGIGVIRAGVWKPRTRPNTFEGMGTKALKWIENVKKLVDVEFATEVASARHVELALEHGLDMVWLGARTTVSPFMVQEIADALKGTDIPVLIKNPVNPDVDLWLGAIERIAHADIQRIGAVHRGFSSYKKTKYRNDPVWQIPLELKRIFPKIPLICDPSHIGGDRSLIEDISQKALDMGYNGLMIETHPDPDQALSDARQQVTPAQLQAIQEHLKVRQTTSDNSIFKSKLEELRERINHTDQELIETLASRMRLIEEIGEYKRDNNVTIFQLDRWNEIIKTRPEWAEHAGLNKEFIEELYKLIHTESIRNQTNILHQHTTKTK